MFQYTQQVLSLLRRALLSPGKSFAILASIFGLAVILLMPPFTGTDEEAHFVRAYGISEGVLVVDESRRVQMPKSYRKTLGCMQTRQPIIGDIYRFTYTRHSQDKKQMVLCALKTNLDISDTEPIMTTAPGYSPTTYIPQAITIFISKLFHLPIIVMVYAARLAVLFTYIAMIVFAIRLLPKRRWSLVGIALLPNIIGPLAGYGGDYMLIGSTAILMAAIARSIYLPKDQRAKEDKKLLTIILIAAIFMVLPKGAFPGVCILPMILFYGGVRQVPFIKILLIFIALGTAILWQKYGAVVAMGAAIQEPNSVLDLPYALTKTLLSGWVNHDFIYGSRGTRLPALAITLMNILFAVYLFVGYSGEKAKLQLHKTQQRWMVYLAWIITGLVIVGSFAALYLAAAYMQDDTGTIRGVQPRYFIIAYIVLATIPFAGIIRTSQKIYRKIVLYGSTALLSFLVLAIAIRFQWVML